MQTLRELQRQFAECVFDATRRRGETWIRAGSLTPALHMNVYRNNMYAGLREALRAVFPVIERLVGVEYFRQCAARYVRLHPSRSGNLHDFGADFPAYLGTLRSAASLPYLADVARLEWAWHEAFHAAAAEPLNLPALAAVRPDDYPRLRFGLHPSARLLWSEYPLLQIWEVNQADDEEMPLLWLDAGGTQLLVLRRALTVEIQTLSTGAAALLSAMARGEDFAVACSAALESEADFDITSCLQQHIRQGAIVDFSIVTEREGEYAPAPVTPRTNN